jgi:hypothetical protein
MIVRYLVTSFRLQWLYSIQKIVAYFSHPKTLVASQCSWQQNSENDCGKKRGKFTVWGSVADLVRCGGGRSMWPISVLFPCSRCPPRLGKWQTDLCHRANSAYLSKMFMFLQKFPSHPLNVKSSSALPATDISSSCLPKTEAGSVFKPNISAVYCSVYCFLWTAQVRKCRMRNVPQACGPRTFVGRLCKFLQNAYVFYFIWIASCLLFSTDIPFKRYLVIVGIIRYLIK